MNKVKGSPAIIHSSVRCESDQHEPMVRPEVQRQQRLDLQRQQRQSQHLSYPVKRDCGVSQRAKETTNYMNLSNKTQIFPKKFGSLK